MSVSPRLVLLLAGLLSLAAADPARAGMLKEDFDAPFPAWESSWFHKLSDAHNLCEFWYCVDGQGGVNPPGNQYRGNNPDGLWLTNDTNTSSMPITITFDATFAAKLEWLSIDVASYLDTTLLAWDADGHLIESQVVTPTFGGTSMPGVYETHVIRSSRGISSFQFTGAAGGNLSIDNVVAKTSTKCVVVKGKRYCTSP